MVQMLAACCFLLAAGSWLLPAGVYLLALSLFLSSPGGRKDGQKQFSQAALSVWVGGPCLNSCILSAQYSGSKMEGFPEGKLKKSVKLDHVFIYISIRHVW